MLENVIGTWKQTSRDNLNVRFRQSVDRQMKAPTQSFGFDSVYLRMPATIVRASRLIGTEWSHVPHGTNRDLQDVVSYSEAARPQHWSLATRQPCTNCYLTNNTQIGGTLIQYRSALDNT